MNPISNFPVDAEIAMLPVLALIAAAKLQPPVGSKVGVRW